MPLASTTVTGQVASTCVVLLSGRLYSMEVLHFEGRQMLSLRVVFRLGDAKYHNVHFMTSFVSRYLLFRRFLTRIFVLSKFRKAGETIRQAAERTARRVLVKTATEKGQPDDVSQLHFVGNCPAGWFWRKAAEDQRGPTGNFGDKVRTNGEWQGTSARCRTKLPEVLCSAH